jgi:hypothetical protein
MLIFALPVGLLRGAPAPEDTGPWFIDLSSQTNVKLTDEFHSGQSGNNLAKLPTGKQKMADVRFNIGTGVMQLGSANLADKPKMIEGIKVEHTADRLRFLHATGWGFTVADGQVVAKFVVHYDDKTTADIELAIGRDLCDWWMSPERKDPTVAKVAWEGENDAAKAAGQKIKLYMTTWDNPHPKKKIVSIDYVATMPNTAVSPFCVAITAEQK